MKPKASQNKVSQLKKVIREQVKQILKEIYSVSVTVPLKYARKAQDIYQSEFRNLGTMEETDTYIFKSEDVADDFIHTLVAAGIPNDGINQQLMETTKVKKQ